MSSQAAVISFLTTVLSLFASVLSLAAQTYAPHWVYSAEADSMAHVWFRTAFVCDGRPCQTSITVTSTGCYKLYVNECNVGTALYHPLRYSGDTTAVATTFDVTRYMRPDSNVVAIVYSPMTPRITRRQIAVNIYGTARNGKKFCMASDGDWLCRLANSRMTDNGGEETDGREHNTSWKAAAVNDAAMWNSAQCFSQSFITDDMVPLVINNGYDAVAIKNIRSFDGAHITQNPVKILLSNSFWGFLRITLRNAKRGERIAIGNLTYICSGTMDEQAFPLFSICSHSSLYISGDESFRPTQITGIDLVETKDTIRRSIVPE